MPMARQDSPDRRRLTLAVDDDLWNWLEFAGARPVLTGGRRGMTAYINAAIRRDMDRTDPKIVELYRSLLELDGKAVGNGDEADGEDSR